MVSADVAVELGVDRLVDDEAAEAEVGEHRRGVGADRCVHEPRRPLGDGRRQGVGQHGLAAAQLAREVLLSVDRHGGGRVEHIGGDGQHLVAIERVAQRDGESRVAAGEVIEEDRRELHGDRPLDRRRQLGDQRQALAAVGDLVVGQRRPGVGRGGDDGHVHRRADAVLDGQALDERDVLGDAAGRRRAARR